MSNGPGPAFLGINKQPMKSNEPCATTERVDETRSVASGGILPLGLNWPPPTQGSRAYYYFSQMWRPYDSFKVRVGKVGVTSGQAGWIFLIRISICFSHQTQTENDSKETRKQKKQTKNSNGYVNIK